MKRDVRQLTLEYLATHQVMTLATVGTGGVWASAVFYVNDGFDLYFLSAGHTRHAQNMAQDGKTAVSIQEDYKDWPAIKGIQAEGTVSLLVDPQRQTAIALYQSKYPFIAQPNPQIQAALAKVNWYCLRPSRLYFIDNSLGLGHREEVQMSEQ